MLDVDTFLTTLYVMVDDLATPNCQHRQHLRSQAHKRPCVQAR